MSRAARVLLALLLVFMPAGRVLAQGTGIVPVDDPAYAELDRLSELGVLGSMVIGQRPYSRREVARIITVARARLDGGSSRLRTTIGSDGSAYADGVLRRLELRFGGDSHTGGEPVVSLLDDGAVKFAATDADRRGFPAPHSRPVEATIDPLALRRVGAPAVRGQTIALEASQRVEPTDWLAVTARERVEARRTTIPGASSSGGELLLASMRARMRNVAVSVGRQQVAWAQTRDHGLFLASDAPALDQLVVTGDRPFTMPGPLRLLGSTQATLIFANLGASVSRSHSKLLAYKVSVSPASAVEIGGTFLNHFGGAGGRSSSLGNRIIDFLPFIDIFRTHNYTDSSRTLDVESDKVLGLDGRVRIDPLGGVLVAGEMLIDDFDVRRLPNHLTGTGSQTLAIIIPRLGSSSLSLMLSAKHMGILTYTHTPLTSGIRSRGRLLGDELGPDAKSFGAQLRWIPTANVRAELEGRAAIYSNASYVSFYADSAKVNYVIRKLTSAPDELRDIAIASLALQTDDAIALSFRAGAQRVRNASFQGGKRYDYVADLALRFSR